MKICYIADSIVPSKSANSVHVVKMCEAFARNGHDVVLFALAPGKDWDEGYIYRYYKISPTFKLNLIWVPRITGRLYLFAIMVYIKLIRIKPDLLYGRSLIGIYLCCGMTRQIIFEIHTTIWESRKLHKDFFTRIIKRKNLKRIVTISQALKNMILKSFPFVDSGLIIIARSGASDLYYNGAVTTNNGNLKIGYVGNIYKGRGIELLINIGNILINDEFHIIGGNKEDIKERLSIDTMPDNFIFHGHVMHSTTFEIQKEMDILVAPYQKSVFVEGGRNTGNYMSPMKIFEYMASSRAIICSDLPALREILNEENAILVPHDSIEAWINAINLLRDKDIRNKLGARAYKDFQEKYTWDKRAELVLA